MLALEDYRTLNTMNVNSVPEWYRSERYEYCEHYFEKKGKTRLHSFLTMVLTFIIG